MDALLEKEEFDIREYHEMRRHFNDVIESTLDANMRMKLRDSWYSMGKALDKKLKDTKNSGILPEFLNKSCLPNRSMFFY